MKVLLGLTIILGGLLITKNSYAGDFKKPASSVTSDAPVYVSGIDYRAHAENAVGASPANCPLNSHHGNKGGLKTADSFRAVRKTDK